MMQGCTIFLQTQVRRAVAKCQSLMILPCIDSRERDPLIKELRVEEAQQQVGLAAGRL